MSKNTTIELTPDEKEEIFLSLSIRCGYIETGTINRAVDLERSGQKDKIRVLPVSSMRKIIFLEDLMKKIYQ